MSGRKIYSYKTDESFLEKIALGATGTKQVSEDLTKQGHKIMELERGSTTFKIWKEIKIKRHRMPDLLCLNCATRAESRAKSKMEISMSHSLADPERAWDYNLDDKDLVALVYCKKSGTEPWEWSASQIVQYVTVKALKDAQRMGHAKVEGAKGAQEGFEVRIKWPAAVAAFDTVVEEILPDLIRLRGEAEGRPKVVRLQRRGYRIVPCIENGDKISNGQIVASVIPIQRATRCAGGTGFNTWKALASSVSVADRYTAVKALGQGREPGAGDNILLARINDKSEHIYVQVDSAAGLMRHGIEEGEKFLIKTLNEGAAQPRLESAIVLSEVGTGSAVKILINTLKDNDQIPGIRAGAAWSLGEIGKKEALPALIESFNLLDVSIRMEAVRALGKLAKKHTADVVQKLPSGNTNERPGVAWALSKSGGFSINQLLSNGMDEDMRHWVSYAIGTQERETMLPEIEILSQRDPQIHFAVTMLWKIMSSWVYEIEEF